MSREVFVALSGAQSAWEHMQTLSENLANASTTGFKEHRVAFSLTSAGGPNGQAYCRIDTNERDLSDGELIQDGDPTHFAIRGRGFFVVNDGGEQHLIRSGAFDLDPQGYLVTSHGARVQGPGGDIRIPEEVRGFEVSHDGLVLDEHGAELSRLHIVEGDDPQPIGEGRWKVAGELRQASESRIVQGALESSNTNALRCMVELVENSRVFDMYQKSIQTSEEMDRMVNTMEGR